MGEEESSQNAATTTTTDAHLAPSVEAAHMLTSTSTPTPTPTLGLVASVTPAATVRAWQTAVHPRLPMLATCTLDREVNIYSLSNFVKLGSITGGHKRSIRTCAWKPNVAHESVLATGSFDASVGIWRRDDDYDDSSRERSGEGGGGGGNAEVDFTRRQHDGNDEDNVDDEREEDEEWRYALVLDGHDSEVKSVAWSAGGNLLATCARDKSVWVWEEVGDDDYETVAVLQEHTADVKSVAWHPEEELLASGSYDDDVRLWREDVDDWDCVAVLRGHAGTVWMVGFEGLRPSLNFRHGGRPLGDGQQRWLSRREAAGPRLVSCSEDRTIRVWRRVPRERGATQNTMSIIRTGSIAEDWVEEARLPVAHSRAIYAVAWSPESGRIVSTGSDGKIVVYEERWEEKPETSVGQEARSEAEGLQQTAGTEPAETTEAAAGATESVEDKGQPSLNGLTRWHVCAELEEAHDVYEINHVTWSRRVDKDKSYEGEEVVVSTGDDGGVKIWSVNTLGA